MTHATATTIAPDRLRAYAAAVTLVGDVEAMKVTIYRIVTDMAILKREGRKNALVGAGHLLGGVLRRLCATAAGSQEDADMKTAVLLLAHPLCREGVAGALTGAMVDEAIRAEAERWPASRH